MTTVIVAALALACASAPAPEEEGKPRVYTNEDLDRVSPLRGETGVLSQPAAAPVAEPEGRGATRAGSARSGTGEAYWRREAARVRDRVRPLQDRVRALRKKVDQRRRLADVSPSTDPQIRAWQDDLGELEARIHEMEIDLEDRARREGAMPGWLRP